ncbi:MAG: patatin-like phospholipase family protein [Hydrogenophaga sp.]|uniref:Patatin-like phospholipase family protein n=1 Tax=Hydrogenophaga crocea TaxID=2716225 RepID=A0A6G8IH15_9BURK|nr:MULTISPECIES: patatin-like phospholipase family protein [Hydrogenophaga]MBL0944609.1 patatin-like phospholipase family protein [Hydrogenophaga sp.]QIM52433.1 patatin-like phospholipase family protein [Hydrogenophaga crocea]
MVLTKYLGRVVGLCALVVLVGCSTAPTVVDLPEPPPAVTPPTPPVVLTRPPRLGLALGGGAARGFAHIGVIQELERAGIRPDLVAGTSAGSLVGTLYASGMNGAELERVALQMQEAEITDWSLPILGRGLLRGEALQRYVRKAVDGKLLENMALPLGVLATDLQTGRGVLFRRGDAATAVRASSAVPGVFSPVKIGETEYVDGGLTAPVPVRQAREMGAEVVLAVDVSSVPEHNPAVGNLEVVLQTFAIMGQNINRHELTTADVVLRPALNGMSGADFSARKRAIEAGRQAARAALPQIKEVLLAKRRPL